jgi:hypothetical protein
MMTWWRLGRNRPGSATAAGSAPPLLIRSAEPDGAWRDLPALQRTLADPLRPVAINEDFRNSLASYADPSFLAPLAHQVDPEAGGLVGGLAWPGVPYAHAMGPELAVPAPTKPTVMRRRGPSARSEDVHTPLIQRSVILDASAHLSTVALTLPETGWSNSESEAADADPPASTLAEVSAPDAPTADAPHAPTQAGIWSEPPASTEGVLPQESSASTEALLPHEFSAPTEAALPQESPAPTEAALPQESPAPTEVASSGPFSADTTLTEGAPTRKWSVEASSGRRDRSEVAAPVTPVRELPVVARSVDRSMGSELPKGPERSGPARSTESVLRSGPKPAPATSSPAMPVVNRSIDPAAESAPLSGFAETITRMTAARDAPANVGGVGNSDDHTTASNDEASSSDDHAATGEDHVAGGDDHPPTGEDQAFRSDDHPAVGKDHVAGSDDRHAASARPASLPVQRVAREGRSAGGKAELPVVAESAAATVVPDTSLPVLSSQADAGSASADESGQRQSEPRIDTPTLGVQLVRAPLTPQRTPMTERVSSPAEPAVQRVQFVTPQVAPVPRASADSVTSTRARSQAPTPASSPLVSTPAPPLARVTPPTVQRLPSPEGKPGSNSPARHSLTVSRRETQAGDATEAMSLRQEFPMQRVESPMQRVESPMQRVEPPVQRVEFPIERVEPPAQRLALFESVASTPVLAPDLTVRSAHPTSEVETPAQEVPSGPVVAEVPMSSTVAETSPGRAIPEIAIGPAVVAEPWIAGTETSGLGAAVQARDSSLPTVSRRAADVPVTYQTSRSGGSNPAMAVGPPLSVQRAAVLRAPSSGAVPSPLIVSRQPAPTEVPSEPGNGRAMSFASMFGSAGNGESASAAEDGFTTVQLQSAGESTPPSSTPAADTASAPPASSEPPPPARPGTSPADLDEMARRLYEPLSARLKEELWLDRERAGVMSDAQ